MHLHKGLKQPKPATYTRKTTPFIDRDFQLRYTLLIIGAAAVGMILVIVPIYYFINQNYGIFVSLAFETSPGILKYLEREKILINSILFAVFCGTLLFFAIIGFRMTSRIVGPIMVIKNHLKLLTRGHWHLPPVRTRENDEFRELVDVYNYFYNSFQATLRSELERLEQVHVDPKNRDAYLAWKSLVDDKRAQLALPSDDNSTSSNGEADASTRDLHHVS